jgi:DNA polymerase-3 subunit delta'
MTVGVTDAWATVVGQDHLVAVLRQAVVEDALTHAFVLVGDAGLGQRELARALAAALNCPAGIAGAGCGACEVCDRLVRGVHPAVIELEPDGAHHVVADVRDVWLPAAALTMSEGRRRVMRVVAADMMNVAAQNALLKLLEEPPASVVWLLEVERDTALLETVRSRCHVLRLGALDTDALRVVADQAGVVVADRDLLIGLSGGSPERLRELADGELFSLRGQAVMLLERLHASGPVAAFEDAKTLVAAAKQAVSRVKDANAAERGALEEAYGVEGRHGFPPGVLTRLNRTHERRERAAQRHALQFFLTQLHSYLRDVSLVRLGIDVSAVLNRDCVAQLQADAARLGDDDVQDAVAALARCEDALRANGAPEVHVERLFLVLALLLYGK